MGYYEYEYATEVTHAVAPPSLLGNLSEYCDTNCYCVCVHVGARCGVDARTAPPFMEATDASRLVCVSSWFRIKNTPSLTNCYCVQCTITTTFTSGPSGWTVPHQARARDLDARTTRNTTVDTISLRHTACVGALGNCQTIRGC